MQKFFTKGLSLILIFSVFLSFSAAPALAAVAYQYDANGNMTSDGTDCYHYNEANQMDKVTNCGNGQTIAEYVYDYNGTRLVKKEYTNGTLSKTIYSPADEYETVKQASNGATANTSYYKANDETVAKKNPDGTITYYTNDHLGSTAVLSDQTGAVVEKTTYAPYGEVKSGGTQSKFGYTGQEQDPESGLDYYNARYYNPHMQRFTQPDTYTQNIYNPQDLNEYSYVLNNPIRYTDPTGHCIPWCIPLITGAVGAAIGVGAQYLENPNSSWQDYTKAGTIGFATGAAAPLIEAEAAGATIGLLARAALPTVAKTVVSHGVGIATASLSTNVFTNVANGLDPRAGLGTSTGADMIASYITDGMVPHISGAIPSLLHASKVGPKAETIITAEAINNVFSRLIEPFFNTLKPNSTQQTKSINNKLKQTYLNASKK